MDDSKSSSKLLERLDKAENLLFSFLSDAERILRTFSVMMSFATEQMELNSEEKEIEDVAAEAFRKLTQLGLMLKEITKDLPLDIPKQPKKDNSKRLQNENLALVLENYINEINSVVDKEKIKFPNSFQFNMLDP